MSSTLAGFSPDRLASSRTARTAHAVAADKAAVRIERLLDTARVPTDARMRDRGALDRDALLRLREAIDAVLTALDADRRR